MRKIVFVRTICVTINVYLFLSLLLTYLFTYYMEQSPS